MKSKKPFWKNQFFYINFFFILGFTTGSYFINKFIASTEYVPFGITIFGIATGWLTKIKDYIDENDPTSQIGKVKDENRNLRKVIEEKQAKINSLTIKIQESKSLKELKETVSIWYINTDKECYYSEKADNKLKDENKKALKELEQYMPRRTDI